MVCVELRRVRFQFMALFSYQQAASVYEAQHSSIFVLEKSIVSLLCIFTLFSQTTALSSYSRKVTLVTKRFLARTPKLEFST